MLTGKNDSRNGKASEAKTRFFGLLVGGLGEGAAQRGLLGLLYSVSKKGGECTGMLYYYHL